MNASVITALADAATGGLASGLNQHARAMVQWLAQDKLRRQELYEEFPRAQLVPR
jgi:hypothetical protein